MTTYTNTQEPLADPFYPIPLSQCCKYHNGENTTIMSHDVQVCRKCGVIFDLNIRKNKDCPLCSAGEHTKLRINDISNSK